MNLDYKVVWSKTKNCYIVVSEIAKRHGKGKPARTCAAALLAAFALTSVMGMSEAQANTINANVISDGDAKISLNGAAGVAGMVKALPFICRMATPSSIQRLVLTKTAIS